RRCLAPTEGRYSGGMPVLWKQGAPLKKSCDEAQVVSRASKAPGASIDLVKVEATEVEGRKVYSVRGFNNGVARWLNKLPTLWIEGEVTELRRQERWAS